MTFIVLPWVLLLVVTAILLLQIRRQSRLFDLSVTMLFSAISDVHRALERANDARAEAALWRSRVESCNRQIGRRKRASKRAAQDRALEARKKARGIEGLIAASRSANQALADWVGRYRVRKVRRMLWARESRWRSLYNDPAPLAPGPLRDAAPQLYIHLKEAIRFLEPIAKTALDRNDHDEGACDALEWVGYCRMALARAEGRK